MESTGTFLMREMSARKRNILLKRRRLPEEFRAQSEECAAITELRSRPPLVEMPEKEIDTRRQKTIAAELHHLSDGNDFNRPLKPRDIGIF